MSINTSDLRPDFRWKNSTAKPEEYLEEPWAHSQDVQQAYLDARFHKREAFLENVTYNDRARIKHELERIAKVRRRFSANENKKTLVKKLETSLHEWRNCVTKNETLLEEIDQKREEEIKRDEKLKREEGLNQREKLQHGWYTEERCEREREFLREFLQRPKTWETPGAGAGDQPAGKDRRSKRRSSLSRFGMARGTKAGTQQAPKSTSIPEDGADGHSGEPEPLYGLKASAMYFKKVKDEESAWRGFTHEHKRYGKTGFPNQKIPMHELLESAEDNPLMEPCPKDCIRYFHFPTNNMQWIEKAIARYYNEEPETLDDRHHTYSRNAKKTEKLLSREFWRGQMHGSSAYGSNPRTQQGNAPYPTDDWAKKGGPIHARHMRSKCAIIPRDPATHQHRPGSSAPAPEGLNLTESNSFRDRISSKDKNVALFLPYMHWETSGRRAKMVQVVNETIGHKKNDPALLNVTIKTMEETKKSKMSNMVKPWRQLLATYLFTLAQVAEQMDYEADERLLREYVKEDPPLHIRRTLDQYYFVTLDDTSQRDKDQVVYRGTLDRKENKTQSRVVMVDQLWLWILDDNTIITSFPRRWGRNKPDPSGVHKSLRERFEARPEDIRSVQHLALIIIDQCSRVFFDRTKPLDQRPEVMDIFASAIAHVDQMTAVAYDTFWRHTSLYNQNMLPKGIGTKYLDINPEGALLKEAQDIAEELKMMKRIYNEQLKVVKDFKRHLIHPQGRREAKKDSASQLQKLLEDLIDSRDKQEGDEEEHDGAETPKHKQSQVTNQIADETLHEAEVVLDLVRSRRAEILELEASALHTCRQLEGFLTLKQQQASIVEAKAALQRAEESVKQGRAIMAFTIVTIFFLPLGFFAAFFGMNNVDINDAKWMTLNDQIKYMFSLSTVVIVLSTSIAFYPSMRPLLAPIIKPSRALYEIFADPQSPTNKSLEARRLLREVQKRIERRDAGGQGTPPNVWKDKRNLGEPQNTIKLMGVFTWLPWGRVKVAKRGENGFLPH